MSRPAATSIRLDPGFPRVSGDEPGQMGGEETHRLFSPRERG